MRSKKQGFTLVELLVVIAIIAVLIGMLLPAIQHARESARRTACGNNLRNIGIALQNYHQTHRKFPYGSSKYRSARNPGGTQIAWSALILQEIDQTNLYNQLNFEKSFSDSTNQEAASQVVPTFICPSGLRGVALSEGRGPTDYGGIYGQRITRPNNPPNGTMLIGKSVSIRQITDGTSNTVIIGEAADWPDGQWINGKNLFDQAFQIGKAPPFENELSSKHPSSVGTCFADGHIQFLSKDTNKETLAHLCTRSGGEVITTRN